MKTRALSPLLILALLLSVVGCSTIDKGADPFIVNSERSIQIAFEGVNAFVEYEAANQVMVKAKYPAVHQFAETVRADAPPAFRNTWTALRTYKAIKTAAAGDALNSTLAKVEAIAHQAVLYLSQIKTK